MILEFVLFCLLLLVYFIMKDRKPRTMPPGPAEVPFLGNTPPIKEEYILELRQKYGNIVTTRVGSDRSVLLFDYHDAKTVLASPDCMDRPALLEVFSLDERKKGGVLFANGKYWQHDRRFMLKNLRNLGMGRTALEGAVHREAEALVDDLRSYGGRPTGIPFSMRTVALNVIWQMVAGMRYDLDSDEVKAVFEATQNFRKNFTPLAFAYVAMPTLQKVCPGFIARSVFRSELMVNFMREVRLIINKHVDVHEEKFKLGDDGSDDLISEYLREMLKNAGDESSLFWRGSLLNNVNDLFSAGSDTIYHMLQWVVHVMAGHPQLVEQLQRQIDSVVPRGQPVSVLDKPNLPLLEAFTTEMYRYSSIVSLNVPRATGSDMKIGGYHIPKGTGVQAVNFYIHSDRKFWEEPHTFRPERFLDNDGKHCAPKEGFIAFGAGKRQCLGENLARQEFFVFAAALLQNFSVRVPEGEVLSTEVTVDGGIRCPKPQPLVYEYRA